METKRIWQYKKQLEKNATPAERLLYSKLKELFQPQQRKYRFDLVMFQAVIGWYIVDFLLPHRMVIVELDGGQHNKLPNRADDIIRNAYLKEQGFYVARYSNREMLEDTDRVLRELDSCLCLEKPLTSFFKTKKILKKQKKLKEEGTLGRPTRYYDE